MGRLFAAASGLMLCATAAQAAPRQADTPERVADAGDKIVCKRFAKTGSLVDSYRTCKTKAEWERERDNLRELDRSYGCRMNDAQATPCK
jgi:hypothetical protein